MTAREVTDYTFAEYKNKLLPTILCTNGNAKKKTCRKLHVLKALLLLKVKRFTISIETRRHMEHSTINYYYVTIL